MSVIKRYNVSEANTLTKPLNLQDITVNPSTESQTFTYDADLGYNGLNTVTVNPITSALDENLIPENIRAGKTIFNVEGTFEGGGAALNRFLGRTATVFTEDDLDGVQNIASNAFYNYTSLTEVSIPASVQNVYSSAFYNCTGLREAYVNSKSLDVSAFNGCNNLRKIVIGENTTSISNITTSNVTSNAFNKLNGSYYLGTLENPYKFLRSGKNDISDRCIRIFGSSLTGSRVFIPKEIEAVEYGAASAVPADGIIYAEVTEKPSTWSSSWNYNNRQVVWGATRKNYSFYDGDNNVITVNKCILDNIPEYLKDGFYNWGAYTSSDFSEEVIVPFIAEEDTSLYYRMETIPKPDASSVDSAYAYTTSFERTFRISPSVGITFFKLTPETSGKYTLLIIKNSGAYDTGLGVFTKSENTYTKIYDDDDSAGNREPKLTGTFTAGTTYYIKVTRYDARAEWEKLPSSLPEVDNSFTLRCTKN